MHPIRKFLTVTTAMLAFSSQVFADEIIVQDGDATLSRDQLAYMVGNWTEQMRAAALADEGDRLELINLELAGVKVANEAGAVAAEDPQLRQEYEADLRAFQRNFVLRQYEKNIEYPDFTRLAKERYGVDRDKYAKIPERRLASHILLASGAGEPRDEKLAQAQQILDELKAGADWVTMVEEYSDEPKAAEKKGLFNYWMSFGDQKVSPPFSEAVFSIAKVGDFAEVTQTQFGVHIIRLDGIKEESYKPFEEVKAGIVKELQGEYRKLAMKEYLARFNMSDEVKVDDTAVSEIIASFKKSPAAEQSPAEAGAVAKDAASSDSAGK